MTIHRAKGLEFPVVCVADLGRAAGGTPQSGCCVGSGGASGLRMAPISSGETVPALDWQRLREAEQEAEAEEERRLFYVAMTRARERFDPLRRHRLRALAGPHPDGPPINWIARALLDDPAGAIAAPAGDRAGGGSPRRTRRGRSSGAGRIARRGCAVCSTRPPRSGTCCRAPRSRPKGGRGLALVRRRCRTRRRCCTLRRCGRDPRRGELSLQLARRVRTLRLPVLSPATPQAAAGPAAAAARRRGHAALAPTTRRSLVHALLEDLDFAPSRGARSRGGPGAG